MQRHPQGKGTHATSKETALKMMQTDIQCRYCMTKVETQEHIHQKCREIDRKMGHITYNRIFQDVDELKKKNS